MDVVAAAGELEAQLGRDRPRSTIRGITRNSDSHQSGCGMRDAGCVISRQRSKIFPAVDAGSSDASTVHTLPASRIPPLGSRSWFLNHVSCRFAYRRVETRIASRSALSEI